jgi:6-pyruvoyltetrahydropterin/6-carboxytetrahydropterin synthase
MSYTISKDFRFEAAHHLPHLPDGHKCKRPHGHSYRVRVEVDGEPDERGFVIDYAEISEAVQPIIERLDHYDLNEVLSVPTTAENLARWIYEQLTISVSRVCVFETPTTCATFHGFEANSQLDRVPPNSSSQRSMLGLEPNL